MAEEPSCRSPYHEEYIQTSVSGNSEGLCRCVHDEGEFFTEDCCVSCSGDPFDDLCDEAFDTIEDAIQEWCSKMGVERGDKSEDEMMDYIHEYEYEDLDTYFYINKFTFE